MSVIFRIFLFPKFYYLTLHHRVFINLRKCIAVTGLPCNYSLIYPDEMIWLTCLAFRKGLMILNLHIKESEPTLSG